MHPASPEEVSCRGNCFYAFNSSLKYSSQEYAATVCKKSGRDFVILSLADIQCHDGEAFSEVGRFYEETVDGLIKKTKPDLITLTGDNAFDALAHLKLIEFL